MAVAQLKVVESEVFSLLEEIQHSSTKLLENLREALLEVRDDTDVGAVRLHAIRALNTLYKDVPVMSAEYALAKLGVLEAIERECIVGHSHALSRAYKWRKALIQRYFGE